MAGLNEVLINVRAVDRASGPLGKLKQTALGVGAGLLGVQVGLATLRSGFAGTIGAAISFESSFAGIRKTMDLTETEFGEMAAANRQMAKEIPVTANEINRLGELAGQLGIRGVTNVVKFERTIADLANTTDLAADQAALSFARIANVMQMPQNQIDRLGSAVVELGNNFATTESQIVDFTTRIAGAGKIANLTAADVAGIATAFTSVGIEAQAGGTAVQKVLIAMNQAVATGSEQLEIFARTLGVTTEEFSRMVREDAAETFVRFVEELGAAGQDAIVILAELGLQDQRLIRAFLGVAGAGDVMRRAVETSNIAFGENTALAEEAGKRYETTAAKLQILRNNAVDFGISIAQTFLPAIRAGATALAEASEYARKTGFAFKALGQAAPTVAVGFAAIGASIIALRMVAFTADVIHLAGSFGAMNVAASTTSGMLGGLSRALRSPIVQASLLAGAFIAIDVATRKLTGGGFLDYLTGATERQKAATAAAEEYGDALERIARFTRAGLTEEQARTKILNELGVNLGRLVALQVELEDQPKMFSGPAVRQASADIKEITAQIESLNATWPELNKIVGDNALLMAALADELEKAREAYDAVLFQRDIDKLKNFTDLWREQHGLLVEVAEEVEDLAAAYKKLNDTLDALEANVARTTLEEIDLTLQIRQLERMKAVMGEAFGPTNQKLLDELIARLDSLAVIDEEITLRFQRMQLAMEKALGPAQAARLSDLFRQTLEALPDEKKLEIILELDQLKLSAVEKVLNALAERQITIPVLLAFQTAGALDGGAAPTIDRVLQDIKERRAGVFESIREIYDAAAAAVTTSTGAAGGAASAAAKQFTEAEQALLGLATAFNASGLTAGEYQARLALVVEAMDRFDVSAEQLYGALQRSGLAADDFAHRLEALVELDRLRDQANEARGAVDSLYDAFNRLFARPTREGAELGLRLAKLEERRAKARMEGAEEDVIEALDDEIDAIRREIDVRRAHQDVMRAELQLADQSLMTDASQILAAQMLTTRMGDVSGASAFLQGQLFLSTVALADWTTQMQGWMGGAGSMFQDFMTLLAAGASHAEAYNILMNPEEFLRWLRGHGVPGFQQGGVMPHTGLAWLEQGERVSRQSEPVGARNVNYGTQNIVLPNVRGRGEVWDELDRVLR